MSDVLSMRKILLTLAIKYNNDYEKIMQAIHARESLNYDEIEKVKKIKGETITIVDEDYPEFFKMQKNPPIVLFLDARDRKQFKDKYSATHVPDVREAFLSHFTFMFLMQSAAETYEEEMKEEEEEFDTSNLA